MNPEEARFAALRGFGWADSIKENCREQRGVSWIENFFRDVQFALRLVRKNPGFSAVAVLTLALCLGANLTIFAVVDSVLLRPLPFPEPDRLTFVFFTTAKAGAATGTTSITSYYDRRGNIPAFSSLALINEATTVVGETGDTRIKTIARVTPEFFSTLGVPLALGRAFTEEELTYTADRVVILTDGYWREQFNADPNVLGKSVRTDGLLREVVGVLPPTFHFLSSKAQIFLPLSSNAERRSAGARYSFNPTMIGRLRPRATVAQAQAQIDADDAPRLAEVPLVKGYGLHSVVAPLGAAHVASARPTLLLLQAGALLLLLIGGVNLVNLMLIRASSRAKEMAIRQSMGANRRQVISQVFTESSLLGLMGGLLGVGVGAAGVRLLMSLGVEQLTLGAAVALNGRLACLALLVAIVIGSLLALPIAWFNLREHLARSLHSESRGSTTTKATQRLRHGFIVTQIALAFVLLTGAGMIALSLKHTMEVSPGFRPDHTLTGQFILSSSKYSEESSRLSFADRLVDEAGHLPGITAFGVASGVPLTGAHGDYVFTVSASERAPDALPLNHYIFGVTGHYFEAIGLRLLAGRFFDSSDSRRDQRVCVVDEDFARYYWPHGSALGQHLFFFPDTEKNSKDFMVVVGVVSAVKQKELTDQSRKGAVYLAYFSHFLFPNCYAVARTSLPPQLLGPALQKIIRGIDPELPLTDIRTMDARLSDTLVTQRSAALLTGIFAGVALLLAAIGTYGVISYAVAQRRREIAVRMALGAQRQQVFNQFLGIGARLILIGIVLGFFGAWAVGKAMASVLFGVSAINFPVLALIAAVMILVVLLAVIVPSRRAARVNPMGMLRSE
jgi:predicted permease